MVARSVGVYRSRGPITNLKIRVRLERRTVAGSVPAISGVAGTSTSHDIELQDIPNQETPGVCVDVEERIIGWQEKLLSRSEMHLYADENNCHTARHREYRQLITGEEKQKPTPARWLFTYLDEDDDATTEKELLIQCRRRTVEVQTIQAANADGLRQRRMSSDLRPEKRTSGFLGRSSTVVSNKPTRNQQRLWHSVATSTRVFRIMADLESTSEVVLCTIRVDEHSGAIRVEPDFKREPYTLHAHVNDLGKETYWYTIENASTKIDEQERLREKDIQNEVNSHRTAQLATLIGHDFESVPWNATSRVHVFGEIVSAESFEYDNLYVNFFLDVSSSSSDAGSWILDDEGHEFPLCGATHTSTAKFLGNQTVAYFGHPFVYRMKKLRDKAEPDEGCRLQSPQIMFQVMSRDSWNRFRTEGYGSLIVPNKPGCHVFSVGTWRPLAISFSGQLRRFFIGGSPELEDFSAIGIPSTHQGPILSKYGMRTETMGTLTIKLQIVRQKQLNAAGLGLQKSFDLDAAHISGINSSSSAALQTSVAAVLEAFHRARNRMLLARENLNF